MEEYLQGYIKLLLTVSSAMVPVHHWDIPINNWGRIHIDYARLFQGIYYLLVIDSKSQRTEIKILHKVPNSETTMKLQVEENYYIL